MCKEIEPLKRFDSSSEIDVDDDELWLDDEDDEEEERGAEGNCGRCAYCLEREREREQGLSRTLEQIFLRYELAEMSEMITRQNRWSFEITSDSKHYFTPTFPYLLAHEAERLGHTTARENEKENEKKRASGKGKGKKISDYQSEKIFSGSSNDWCDVRKEKTPKINRRPVRHPPPPPPSKMFRKAQRVPFCKTDRSSFQRRC
jgi:hypothetical protein